MDRLMARLAASGFGRDKPDDGHPEVGVARFALRLAVAAGVPLAAYMWFRGTSTGPDHDPCFDAFLKRRGPLPTGVVATPPSGSTRGAARDHGGPFENFLRSSGNDDAASTATSSARECGGPFEFFLKSSCKQPVDRAQHNPPPPPPPAFAPLQPAGPAAHNVRVVVMFGTEYGFSKEIAEKVCERLKEEGPYWPVLLDMADYPEGYDLASEQALLMVCSTQGDGVPPTDARDFCEQIFTGKTGCLQHLNFSVCALGDTAYAHFCRCGEMLDAALHKAGGLRIVPRASVNKEDWKVVDGWLDSVMAALKVLPLKPLGAPAGATAAATSDAVKPAAPKPRWGKSRPYYARVVAVEGLCKVASCEDKNTVCVEFDLGSSGITYLPGDALGMYPSNPPEAVDELLAALGAGGHERVAAPSWHYQEHATDAAADASSMALRHALLHCYDLRTPRPGILQLLWDALSTPAATKEPVLLANGHTAGANGHLYDDETPRSNGFAALSKIGDAELLGEVTGSKAAAASVAALNGKAGKGQGAGTITASAGSDSIAAAGVPRTALQGAPLLRALLDGKADCELYFGPRHVIDILEAFPQAKLQAEQLLAVLRPLQPRLYSISSSPLEHPGHVQVSVAEVKYTSMSRERVGVCSTYLSDRIKVGDEVPIYISKNPDFRLPSTASTPIIMIGPGTGLAPFRSFILQRLLQSKQDDQAKAPGPAVLFFGCRRRDQDYLYGDLLEGWAKDGLITLHTAFSREQAGKVYVQQRVQEAGTSIWRLLKAGGHLYVCGDAASMAGAVEQALLQVFEQELMEAGAVGSKIGAVAAAAAYLKELAQQGRYQRDIWY